MTVGTGVTISCARKDEAMNELIVSLAGVAAIAVLAWYFFGPRTARQAEIHGRTQEVAIVVKGGYSPDVIRVRQGVPLRLVFDRQEGSDCTSRVVFPDFQVSKTLPAFQKTVVEFTPDRPGEFQFACGMNMVHGRPNRHMTVSILMAPSRSSTAT